MKTLSLHRVGDPSTVTRPQGGGAWRTPQALVLTASALFLASTVAQARAEPVILSFAGELFDVYDGLAESGFDPLDPSIVVGASFSGTFAYDPTSETDLFPDNPERGEYEVGTTMTGQVGDVAFETTGDFLRIVVRNYATSDSFSAIGYGYRETVGLPFDTVSMGLSQGVPAAFDTDALPITIDLADFGWAEFNMSAMIDPDDGTLFHIQGTITGLTVIPEPGALCLAGFGSLLLLKRRR